MIGLQSPNAKPRMVRGPGSERIFRVLWGDVPPVGAVLLFEKTGRRFRVLEIKPIGGRRTCPAVRVVMLAPDAFDGEPVIRWEFARPLRKRRLANRPRLVSGTTA